MKNCTAKISISIRFNDDCYTGEKGVKEILEMIFEEYPEITIDSIFDFRGWED